MAGLPRSTIAPLQRVQNATARLVARRGPYIFNFIRRNKNDSSKTIIKRKNKQNNINQNKQSIKNTDTKNIITHMSGSPPGLDPPLTE